MKTLKLLLLLLLFAGSNAIATEDPALIKVEVCRQKEALVQLRTSTASGNLVVRSRTKETLHFYVFDVSGNMVYHALLLPGSIRSVNALKNGEYSYDVFLHDEGVEQGKISVQAKHKTI